MLQDWASDDFLKGPFCELTRQYGRTPSRQTNQRLDELVRKHFGFSICETFASNLFPFIKLKSMKAKIPMKHLVLAAEEFALPQITIVAPRLVVALGLDCFNSIRRVLEKEPSRTIGRAMEDPITYCGSRIWCQAHTGRLGRSRATVEGSTEYHRIGKQWQTGFVPIGLEY